MKTLLLFLSFAALSAQAQSLNMLCSTDTDWCEAKAREFSAAAGIKVNMSRRATGEAMAIIKADAANPSYDIWYGGTHDPHLQAAGEGLLQAYSSSKTGEQFAWATALHQGSKQQVMGIYRITLGWGGNKTLLAKKSTPIPRCWKDLLSPAFKGDIEFASPISSGTGYTILATLVQLMGEEPAFDYLKKLHLNVNRYTASGTAQRQAVARGESMLGITFLDEFIPELFTGAPIELALPCEGTGFSIGAMSIIKGAKHLPQAQQFYDWALSPAAQTIVDRAKVIALPSNKFTPVPEAVKALEGANLISYDFAKYGSSAERKRLLSRWDNEVRTLAK
jgi:iron(III) transport system substrate-binding protein